MIEGTVNEDREAMISILILGPTGRERLIDAVIDTGSNGRLTHLNSIIDELELPWVRTAGGTLADDRKILFEVYRATIIWDGNQKTTRIDHAESIPLVGMALMENYELKVQCRHEGKVTLKPLRPTK